MTTSKPPYPTREQIKEANWQTTLDNIREHGEMSPRAVLTSAYIWADEDTAGGYADRFLEALEAAGYTISKASQETGESRG